MPGSASDSELESLSQIMDRWSGGSSGGAVTAPADQQTVAQVVRYLQTARPLLEARPARASRRIARRQIAMRREWQRPWLVASRCQARSHKKDVTKLTEWTSTSLAVQISLISCAPLTHRARPSGNVPFSKGHAHAHTRRRNRSDHHIPTIARTSGDDFLMSIRVRLRQNPVLSAMQEMSRYPHAQHPL